MWNEKVIKIIPAVLFLFCLLECFEMVLIIINLNKTEKLEVQFEENLKELKTMISFRTFQMDKKIKIK
ncbi:hypothetical protein VN1239_14790 [Helicobacter pylori]|nr:hypothetical protein VN1239_14790 [Helicobacter pylori]